MSDGPTRHAYDRLLFRSLRTGIEAGLVVVNINARRLNRAGSPVWDPWENVVPILGMLLLSTIVVFTMSQVIGVSLLLLSVIVHVAIFQPWIMHRVSLRAKSAAMDNVRNWDVLWRIGGLVVTYKSSQPVTCASPAGDWRGFVKQNLPHAEENMETQGIGEETELEKQTHQPPATLNFDSDMSAPHAE
jgi:hypothetical protein